MKVKEEGIQLEFKQTIKINSLDLKINNIL